MKTKLALKLLLVAPALIVASCGSNKFSKSTEEDSSNSQAQTVYTVTTAQWNKEMKMSQDQNYRYRCLANYSGQDMSLLGEYDHGKIWMNLYGQAEYFYQILFDTYDAQNNTADIETYRLMDEKWYVSIDENIDLGMFSENTMRLPFSFEEFTYDSNDKAYRAESLTLYGTTFKNIEYKFENAVLVSTKFSLDIMDADASYQTFFYDHGKASVVLPEATPEKQEGRKEDFVDWIKSIDLDNLPYSRATVNGVLEQDGAEKQEVVINCTWDYQQHVWNGDNGGENVIPSAFYLLETVEAYVSEGYQVYEFYSKDLRSLEFTVTASNIHQVIKAEFNDYALVTYFSLELEANIAESTMHLRQVMEISYY